MIEVKNICFGYSNSNIILKDVSFKAEKGMITTILGPNGSGKTTLLKCIAGFYNLKSGNIKIQGENIETLKRKDKAKLLSYVPQNHMPFFPYKVFDIVIMGRSPHIPLFSSPSKIDKEIAEDALHMVGIMMLKERIYSELSGGERQLVLIARSLAQRAPYMLLDEPVAHLDFKNQIIIMQNLRKIVEEKKVTILITLHDPNIAATFSERIVLLKSGSILKYGDSKETMRTDLLTELYGIEIKVSNSYPKYIYCNNIT